MGDENEIDNLIFEMRWRLRSLATIEIRLSDYTELKTT